MPVDDGDVKKVGLGLNGQVPDARRMRDWAEFAVSQQIYDYTDVVFGLVDSREGRPLRGTSASPIINALWFQHVPTESTETYKVSYDTVEATGRQINSLQFKHGEPRIITFQLFVNEWGVHGNNAGGGKQVMSAEETVRWLRDRMYPQGTGASKTPPRILTFVGWELINVVVVSAKVKRTLLARQLSVRRGRGDKSIKRGQMLRGYIDLELREYMPPPNIVGNKIGR